VSPALREACYALGATRWQAIQRVVLPMALPGILTGSILALSRAIGETAPLIVVGALSYVTFSARRHSLPVHRAADSDF
jgi:phosphate transport system permease protein